MIYFILQGLLSVKNTKPLPDPIVDIGTVAAPKDAVSTILGTSNTYE